MMRREEAIKRFIDIAKEEWDIVEPDISKLPEYKFINEIYDSIGSCGECKHSYYDTGMTDDVFLCSKTSFDLIDSDFFCGYFERKE